MKHKQVIKQSKNFIKVGRIVVIKGKVEFLWDKKTKTEPGVYLWLKPKNKKEFEVHYVGKAGSGPEKRMAQHKQGIHKVGNEDRKQQIINSVGSRENDYLEIWFRVSPKKHTDVSNKKEVSFYSVEEESLIEEYNPPLNRTKRSANRTIQDIESELFEAGGNQFELWSSAKMSNGEFHKLDYLIKKLRQFISPRVWDDFEFKVIGQYTKGKDKIPLTFLGKPLLVFGEIADVNFRDKSVLIALDNFERVGIKNIYLKFEDRNTPNNDESHFSEVSLLGKKKLTM
jgi:hypothetical protein